MPKQWLNKEDVEKAVIGSVSVRDVMRKLGYTTFAGGVHSWLQRKIKVWGIDTSHMLGRRANCGPNRKGGARRKTAADILIYHADGQRQKAIQLRRALDEIERSYVCSGCGIGDWLGKKLMLEVDHKDGDYQNDEEENLEYLCPNCHSQTPTYKNSKRVYASLAESG